MRLRSLPVLLLLAFLFLATTLPAMAQGPDLAAAANWLRSQQADDGGFSDGFSEGSSVPVTAEAILALAGAGEDVSTWGPPSPLDYLAAQAPSQNQGATLAKMILAVEAADLDPTNFAGTNLVAKLQETYDAESGTFQGLVNAHAFAILALHAAGADVPAQAVDVLEGLQEDDGGWSFDANSQSDTNTTATAIQALLAGGREATSESITDALDFLRTQQNSDGGFPYQNPSEYGTETDANSTAYVIQALLAAGQDLSDWNNPTQALAALQLPDGAFEYQKGTGANLLATVQAVPVLAGKTLLDLPRVAASQAPAPETSTGSTPATLPTTGGTGSRAFDLAIAGLVLLGGGLSLTTLARRGAR